MKITDDFLPHHSFFKLQNIFLSNTFPWFYNDFILDDGLDKTNYQFIHSFWHEGKPESDGYVLLDPIWDILKPKEILRAKINLGPRDPEPTQGGWHTDIERDDSLTGVLYFNNTNGYTLFQDGTKVESKANRFAQFPVNTVHTGVSQTDSQVRVVLNLNWIPYS